MKKNNIGTIFILSIVISFICGSIGAYLILESEGGANIVINPKNNIKLIESNSISDSVKNIYDSVVVVEGFKDNNLASTGTGFIYKKEKDTFYIMTNHHVIDGINDVKIILSDKTVLDVEIKGSEAYSDIAVLAVKTDKIKHIATLGDSTKLNVGDTLFTVGSPEGSDYAGTVTKGVLSGKDRLIAVAVSNSQSSDYYMKVLQTDAAINPGNSGGPICNIKGEVIGVTNLKLVDSTVEGMGFAIPIEDALYYAETLEKGESVKRPYLGIGMLDITDGYYLWQNGITIPTNVESGIAILEVVKNSPAEIAKLTKGDIITEIAGTKISSVAEFRYELYKNAPGDSIEIKYVRGGKVKTTTVKLTDNK